MKNKEDKIIILGIGNVLLTDEGIGVHVANELMKKELPSNISVVEGGTDGFRLLNVITEADRLIVIDAVKGGGEPGTIYRFNIEDVKNAPSGFKTSVHQIGILEVIDLSNLIGKTPKTTIVGIEPKSFEMSLELSPEIKEKISTDYDNLPNEQIIEDIFTTEFQEKELINYLIKYGNQDLKVTVYDEFNKPSEITVKAALLILSELQNNEIKFDNANYQLIYEEYLLLINQETYPDEKYFHHHPNSTIANTVISMMTFPYELSKNWELKKQIYTADKKDNLKSSITKSLDVLKEKKLEVKIMENERRLKTAQTDEEYENLLKQRIKMLDIRKKLASATGGRVIIK